MVTARPAEARLVSGIYMKLDGAKVPDRLLDDLLLARIEGSVHLPDLALLEFRNPDFHWTEAEQFKAGQAIEIELGDPSHKRVVFNGEITALEVSLAMSGGVELQIRAYDRAHRLHRGRHTRVFKQTTDSDIAKQVAQEASLTANVQATSEVHEYVLQDNQTDWEFLHDRASRLGFELQVQGKALVFKHPPSAPAEQIDLEWRHELLSFRARMATGEQVSEVQVRGWDPLNKKTVVGKAQTPRGLPAIGETRNGGQIAEKAFGKKASMMVARQAIYSQAQANSLAQTVLDELAGTFVTAEGVAMGDPRLRLGSEVNLKSVGTQFNGKYIVTQIAHIYERTGYRIEFEVTGRRSTDVISLMSSPRTQHGPHLFIGIVTDNKDPQDVGRVKVKIPALGDNIDSHWCRLVTLGAGKGRGIEFLPEVEDEVLVVGTDVNNLYLLGGLWSKIDNPPFKNAQAVGGTGKVNKRTLRSREGHEIVLDDTEGAGSVTIGDSGGNKIVFDTSKNNLDVTIGGNIKLKAGQKIELEAGTSIEIKAGTDASVKAATQLSLEGSTGAKLAGGPKVDVSGASVNIGA